MTLAVAAGLHAAAFPGHLQEGFTVAAFFLLVAVAQVVAACQLARGTGPGARAAILLGNFGLILLWAASRTVGVPGIHGGSPESVALLDLLAVAAEVAVVVGLGIRSSSGTVRVRFAWPALALTALLVGGAGIQWVPAGHAHEHHSSPTAATDEPHSPGAHHSHP